MPAPVATAVVAASATPALPTQPLSIEVPVADTPTPAPTPEATATPEPTPPPARIRHFAPVEAQIVTRTASRAAPSMSARALRDLPALSRVSLVAEEVGENWIIGDQDWVPLAHDWESTWYRLDDGGYVHRAFVFMPDSGPLPPAGGAERYVVVDLDALRAYAMAGATVVREMPITAGKPGFETPAGEFRVLDGGRILDERMTSQRAGFSDPNDRYDVERVLFTQYFAEGGFALHLNYWQPVRVFGNVETSHGCVGLLLEDAQFLWMFGHPGMRVVVRNGGGPQPLPPIATPTPPPPPPVEVVKIFAVVDGPAGAEAVIAARTAPGTVCAVTHVTLSGVRREPKGTGSKTADAGGWLEWRWTIEPDTPSGKGAVIVTCPGGNATADFTIR